MTPRKRFSFFTWVTSKSISFTVAILTSLVSIGDGVKSIGQFAVEIPRTITTIITTLYQETSSASKSWMKEKIRAEKRKQKIPCQKPSFTWPKIYFPHIKLPKLTLKLPKIIFPRIKIPKITPNPILPIPPLMIKTGLHMQSLVIGIALTILFILLPYNMWLFLTSLPNPQILTQRDLEVSTKIFDKNGRILYEIYGDQNRTPVALTSIPQHVVNATIAIEDRDFYKHLGFSPRGMLRSMREIVIYKRIQGGSTITQQLIKSALLTPDVNLVRKAKELILAFWAERLYSKDQILEMYFNQVPYGGTAWGIEAASQMYFKKSVTKLTLAQSAILAGLPAAPSVYSPFGNHPEKAYIRQREVLRRMEEDGMITKDEHREALNEQLNFATPRITIRAPHFVMYIKELLEKLYGTRMVERGGLRVTTSLDLSIQEKIETIVSTHINSLTNLQVGNGAALVVNPKTGEIIAMVGSRDYFDTARDGNVNVTTSMQQPGSAIKVVTYAAALENGMTAASLIDDSPIAFPQIGAPLYTPVNYDGKFHGLVPLRVALGNSYNIPAVKTLAKIGIPAIMQMAQKMGIQSWKDPSRYGLSLTLGGGEVTMLEMASVYATLGNNGKHVSLMPILSVADYTGKVIDEFKIDKGSQAVTPEISWIMTNILSDNAARSQAFGFNSSLVIPDKTVAVKTGTTNEKRDNWTAGYTPSYASVVWVGNNDNSPMNPYLTSGITGAAPIWHDIMVELLKNMPNEAPEKPENVLSIPCYFGKIEYFVRGTEPASGRCAPIPTPSPPAGGSPTPTP